MLFSEKSQRTYAQRNHNLMYGAYEWKFYISTEDECAGGSVGGVGWNKK